MTEDSGHDNGFDKWKPTTSQYIVIAVSFCMVIDYTMSLMSIQTLWYLLEGTEGSSGMYGFAFGAYDLTQTIFAPLIGYLADKYPFKWVLLSTVIINVCGNVVYGFAFFMESSTCIILGRLIAGIGSGNLALCMLYLTSSTSLEQRTEAIGTLRMVQTVGRFFGPNVGYIFLWMPTTSFNGSVISRLFNFYSAPGWIAAVISFIVALCIIPVTMEDGTPKTKNGSLNEPFLSPITQPVDQSLSLSITEPGTKTFLRKTWVLYISNFAIPAVLWSVLSQLSGICFGLYHMVNAQDEIWKVYVAMGAGTFVGLKMWKFLAVKRKWSEPAYTPLGACLAGAGIIVISNTSSNYNAPPEFRYYLGTCVITVGMQLFYPGISTSLSKALTINGELVTGREGVLQGVFVMCGSLARFVGPWIGDAVMELKPKPGADGCNYDPAGDLENVCCIGNPNAFYVDGCYMKNSSYFIIGVGAFTIVLGVFLRLWPNSFPVSHGMPQEQLSP